MLRMGEKATAGLQAELHRTELQLSNWVAEREQQVGDIQVWPAPNDRLTSTGYIVLKIHLKCCSGLVLAWHALCGSNQRTHFMVSNSNPRFLKVARTAF